MENTSFPFIAFDGCHCIASGPLPDVALAFKARAESDPSARLLMFNARTSEQVDFDYRGSAEDVLRRLAPLMEADTSEVSAEAPSAESGRRGRPRLGVVAREVTLLPRHWEWLGRQPGGASVALRKLVECARREAAAADELRDAQTACFRFMSAMAGNLPGFEEASRALFAGDRQRFGELIAGWPEDIREHLFDLAERATARVTTEDASHA